MTIFFTKMHALGNDFMIVDMRLMNASWMPSTQQVRWLGDRRCGVGFDQLLMLQDAEQADVDVQIYNADGSRAKACGNGARCVAWLCMQQKQMREVVLSVEGRLIRAWKGELPYEVGVDMGTSNVALFQKNLGIWCLGAATVEIGNLHVVVFVDSKNQINAEQEGRRIADLPFFNGNFNVDFVKVESRNQIHVETFERGVGLTPACGSGACASVCAAVFLGYCDREEVIVYQKNGDLRVSSLDPVTLMGEVSFVFKGEVSYSAE